MQDKTRKTIADLAEDFTETNGELRIRNGKHKYLTTVHLNPLPIINYELLRPVTIK